ncbi:hypothetical protein RP20_CCG011614 [Aedes albopictus]|nr:hypothetical protein RP20_CCG011614 [Aedes albopictus]
MLMAKAHKEPVNAVQVFGRKITETKTATTVENCKHRKCLLRELPLDEQCYFAQICAIRQAISTTLVSFYPKVQPFR